MTRALLALAAVVAASLGFGFGGSAAETISINARPTILRWAQATMLSGGIGSGKAEVDVYIEGQTCAEGPWDVISGAHTAEGGRFTAEFGAGISLLVRAKAEGATSNVVKIQQRPSITLQQRLPGRFFVFVNAARTFWKKRVVLQRFETGRRTWVNLHSAPLTETGSNPGSPFQWSKTDSFRQKVPKGTLLRAMLPLAQARPCYLAGYSNLLRR